MHPTPNQNLNHATHKEVYYFTPEFEALDSFSAHAVKIWGITFPTVEHAYQWKKYSSSNPDIAEQILTAKSPHAVKIISNANKQARSTDWEENKVKIMTQIYQAKADQHEDVRDALKRTGQRTIIENSPVDSFWGSGPDGTGENMLGKIWMKIRDSF